MIDKSTGAEKREAHEAVADSYARITEWLDSFEGSPLSPEAEAFLYLQAALDEMGWPVRNESRDGLMRVTRCRAWQSFHHGGHGAHGETLLVVLGSEEE